MNAPSIADVVFSYLPYLAVFGLLAAWMYRWGILRNDQGPPVAGISVASEGALLLGFATLLAGHVITILAPNTMAALLADIERVAVLETIGLVAALLFSWGVFARLRQRWRAMRQGVAQQQPRVLLLALVFVTSLSGVWLTINVRWITAWYAYILAPYLRSLLVMEPQTLSVVASPWAVKLHALLFMTLLAAWPMAGLPWEEIFPVKAIARRIADGSGGKETIR